MKNDAPWRGLGRAGTTPEPSPRHPKHLAGRRGALSLGVSLAMVLVVMVVTLPDAEARRLGSKGARWLIATSTTAAAPTTTGPTSTTAAPTTTTTAAPATTTTVPATTTTTVAPAPTAPSGAAMPVGDLPGWRQIFTDDFTTNVPVGSFPSAVSSRWGAYNDGWGDTSGHGVYMPSKVLSVSGGMLNYAIHTEAGKHLVSAPWPKIKGASTTSGNAQLYGRYVVRFRADALPLYKTAWLLWPASKVWPRDGEIDFPEGNLDGTIKAFMHRQDATSGSDQDAYYTNATYPSWHTAIIEWKPTSLTFILDGTVVGTSTSRIPNTPMNWVLQTETALTSASPADTTAGNVQIDWVAVYSLA